MQKPLPLDQRFCLQARDYASRPEILPPGRRLNLQAKDCAFKPKNLLPGRRLWLQTKSFASRPNILPPDQIFCLQTKYFASRLNILRPDFFAFSISFARDFAFTIPMCPSCNSIIKYFLPQWAWNIQTETTYLPKIDIHERGKIPLIRAPKYWMEKWKLPSSKLQSNGTLLCQTRNDFEKPERSPIFVDINRSNYALVGYRMLKETAQSNIKITRKN